MSSVQKLAFSIIKFLSDQIVGGGHSEEAIESIEVAQQCLATAFSVNPDDCGHLQTSPDLLTIFLNSASPTAVDIPPAATPIDAESKAKAELLKNEGNEFVKINEHEKAIECYTSAIQLDPRNAIYYSNRAAAYNKLEKYAEAITDCDAAIAVDPAYSKAYSRKGLALSALGNHQEAVAFYRKALQLEPDNSSYRGNLQVAEEQLKQTAAGGGGPMGGFDIMSLLSNPGIRNMAASLMSNPNVQQMMENLMPAAAQPNQPQPEGTTGAGGPVGMDQLLRVGQQMAQMMQQSNPELIDQLRKQMQEGGGGAGGPPPPSPST